MHEFFLHIVWIYVRMSMEYLSIWTSRSVFKNSLKMGYVAVMLGEVSAACKGNKSLIFVTIQLNYHHICTNWNVSL